MGMFDKVNKKINDGKKSIIKNKVKLAINNKLGLDGEYDEIIDKAADKAVEKIGVDNIIKANKTINDWKK